MKRKSSNSPRPGHIGPSADEASKSMASSAANAVLMLDRCLLHHDIGLENHRSILKDAVKELSHLFPKEQIVPQNMLQTLSSSESNEMESDEEEEEGGNSQKRSSPRSKSKFFKKATDDHNELCEICDLGGDLLCCDTCTLVFHKKCLRPSVTHFPKGKWSCPHCVIDGLCDGNVANAKNSITRMRLLSCGFDYVSEFTEDDRFPPDVSIVRANRMFVSRKAIRGLLVEYGRYYELEEAFLSLLQKEDDEEPDPTCEALWCTECLDNPEISVCLFCGCKVCLGKFDSKNLLICDGCEGETHTYCLSTPLDKIPDSSWYCKQCTEKNIEAGTVIKKQSIKTAKLAKESADLISNSKSGGESNNRNNPSASKVNISSSSLPSSTATTVKLSRGRPSLSSTLQSANKTGVVRKQAPSANLSSNSVEGGQIFPNDSLDHKLSKFECSSDEIMRHITPRGIVGAKDVVAIIKKMAYRELTHDEKRCLKYFRDWAVASDIENSIQILHIIRDALAKRAVAEDPSFELSSVSDNELSKKRKSATDVDKK